MRNRESERDRVFSIVSVSLKANMHFDVTFIAFYRESLVYFLVFVKDNALSFFVTIIFESATFGAIKAVSLCLSLFLYRVAMRRLAHLHDVTAECPRKNGAFFPTLPLAFVHASSCAAAKEVRSAEFLRVFSVPRASQSSLYRAQRTSLD